LKRGELDRPRGMVVGQRVHLESGKAENRIDKRGGDLRDPDRQKKMPKEGGNCEGKAPKRLVSVLRGGEGA